VCDHPALCALDEVEALMDWNRIVALLPAGEEKALTEPAPIPAVCIKPHPMRNRSLAKPPVLQRCL